ncbi:Hypothetical_protein [Hexamita inflata]|uniref:Hypothetical_protein n=1 Tax=Hexamita inflata TaxID=28002 RepID=A0AA86RJQ3_9EUKA|nr:Hypothetical protein HINF_LOCUS63733 [Hexamita inflata]
MSNQYIDPLDEFNLEPSLKRSSAKDLSDSLAIIAGIKPLTKPLLGKNNQPVIDTALISKFIRDLDKQFDEELEKNPNSMSQKAFDVKQVINNKQSEKIQVIQENIKQTKLLQKKVKKMQSTIEVIEQYLKKIWQSQENFYK